MTVLQERFISFGWRVYCVPEAATIVLGGGVSFADISDEERWFLLLLFFFLSHPFVRLCRASQHHEGHVPA